MKRIRKRLAKLESRYAESGRSTSVRIVRSAKNPIARDENIEV